MHVYVHRGCYELLFVRFFFTVRVLQDFIRMTALIYKKGFIYSFCSYFTDFNSDCSRKPNISPLHKHRSLIARLTTKKGTVVVVNESQDFLSAGILLFWGSKAWVTSGSDAPILCIIGMMTKFGYSLVSK